MRPTTKRILRWLGGVFLVDICYIAWLGYSFLSPNSSRNRASAIHCTLTWGRLAAFPTSARDLNISATGNMLTRGFRSSFTAPAADIEQWLRDSPGTRSVQPSSPAPGIRRFGIVPGGAAQHAEVTVDDAKRLVSIYVYWS